MSEPRSVGSNQLGGSELECIRRFHPNVLIVGPPPTSDRALHVMLPSCRQPVHASSASSVPRAVASGTLVLRDVEELDSTEQRVLYRWLHQQHEQVQVVTVSTTALFRLVSGGSFLEELFYRLNVITVITDSI